MVQIEKPLTSDEELALRVVKPAGMPNEIELEALMRKAAAGKVKVNGITRRPDETYRP